MPDIRAELEENGGESTVSPIPPMNLANLLIAIAYFLVALALLPIAKKSTGDLRTGIVLVGVFITSCGVGRLLDSLEVGSSHPWYLVAVCTSWTLLGILILNRKKLVGLYDALQLLEISWDASIAGKMLFLQEGQDLRLIRQNTKAKEANQGLISPGDMLCEKMPSHREPVYPYTKPLIELYLETTDSSLLEFRYVGQGVEAWFMNMCVRFPETNYLYMTFIDISNIKEAALKDSLTGLFNRRILDHENERWDCCLYLDLDKFKQVNDTRGHAFGDGVLIEVGKVLNQIALDVEGVAVREGGDEFLLLMKSVNYMAVAVRCLSEIGDIRLDCEKSLISASIGLAWGEVEYFLDCERQVDKLILAAETASRKAKSNKRSNSPKDRIVCWGERLKTEQQGTYSIDFYLRNEELYEQLWIAYQPIVNMLTGEVLGAEALLRWSSPVLGLVSPANFIPVAENTGQIHKLTEWVLHETVIQLARWQQKKRSFSVSVNISPVELEDELFVANISKLTDQYGLDIGSLGIEVTERGICDNLDKYLSSLHQLKAANITLKVDDFGTGQSGLSQLLQFPFQEIKIDRSLVPTRKEDVAQIGVCEAIAVLSEGLGFSTIIEGIETEWQRNKMVDMGFQVAQGYYFYRPMSKSGIDELLG